MKRKFDLYIDTCAECGKKATGTFIENTFFNTMKIPLCSVCGSRALIKGVHIKIPESDMDRHTNLRVIIKSDDKKVKG